MQAKFHAGTISLANGATKTGFVQLPDHRDSNIKFRATKDGDTEKIKNDLVKTVDVKFDDGSSETFFCVYPAVMKINGPKKEKNKRWFGSIYVGKTNFLYFSLIGDIKTSIPGMYFYLHTPGDDYTVSFLFEVYGNQKVVGEKKMYKKMIEDHFVDRCPVLVEKSKSGEFVTKDIKEVVDFFKKNCE